MKIRRLGLKQAPASLHDFVPNYLKRVEAGKQLAQRPHGNNDLLYQASMIKVEIKRGEFRMRPLFSVMKMPVATALEVGADPVDIERIDLLFLAVDGGKSLDLSPFKRLSMK